MCVRYVFFGCEPLDGFESIVDAEVPRVRLLAEGVEHQDVEILQQRPALARDLADVGAVGDVADAEAEDVEMGVLQRDRRDLLAEHHERLGRDRAERQLRHVAGVHDVDVRGRTRRRTPVRILPLDLAGAVERHRSAEMRGIGRRSSRPKRWSAW